MSIFSIISKLAHDTLLTCFPRVISSLLLPSSFFLLSSSFIQRYDLHFGFLYAGLKPGFRMYWELWVMLKKLMVSGKTGRQAEIGRDRQTGRDRQRQTDRDRKRDTKREKGDSDVH